MPIVTDDGFEPDDATDLVRPDALPPGEALAVFLPNDGDPVSLVPDFARIGLIVIPFPASSDGRGFSLAHRLRDLGYRGGLRARGHLIPDQYAYARRCGFDAVEIDDALAERIPQPQWLAAATAAQPPFARRGAIR